MTTNYDSVKLAEDYDPDEKSPANDTKLVCHSQSNVAFLINYPNKTIRPVDTSTDPYTKGYRLNYQLKKIDRLNNRHSKCVKYAMRFLAKNFYLNNNGELDDEGKKVLYFHIVDCLDDTIRFIQEYDDQLKETEIKNQLENNDDFQKAVNKYGESFKDQVLEKTDQLFKDGKVLDFVISYLLKHIVKERNNLFIGYLTLISQPSQLFFKGESSEGKTKLMNTLLLTIPKKRYYTVGGLSENAIQYELEKIGDDIDFFYWLEYSASTEGQRQKIRLLSVDDGGYIFSVSIPDKENGGWTSKRIEIRMIGFVSTGVIELDPQDFTRAMVLYPDSSKEQSKRIVTDTFKRWAIVNQQKNYDFEKYVCWEIYERIREFDLTTQWCWSYDPIGEGIITFPANNVKIRRDHKKMIFLAESITKLNFQHRISYKQIVNGKECEFLLTHIKDFSAALDPFQNENEATITGISPKEQTILDIIESHKKTAEELKNREGMTTRELFDESLEKSVGLGLRQFRNYLDKLNDKGFIYKDIDPANKNQNYFILTNKKKQLFKIHEDKAKESFLSWLEKQPDNVQNQIRDHSCFEYYINPLSVPEFLPIEKETDKNPDSEKEVENESNLSEKNDFPYTSDCLYESEIGNESEINRKSKKKPIKTTFSEKKDSKDVVSNRQKSDIGEEYISDHELILKIITEFEMQKKDCTTEILEKELPHIKGLPKRLERMSNDNYIYKQKENWRVNK